MQTGYFVHKVLVICKLLKLTWSCCLLPSTKCTWKTWDCWRTPFQARHVPQLPTPGGLVSPDQNIKHFCHCCFCSVSCCWLVDFSFTCWLVDFLFTFFCYFRCSSFGHWRCSYFSCYFHCTSPASNIGWSHLNKTSSIYAIVVFVLFPVVVVDFLLFQMWYFWYNHVVVVVAIFVVFASCHCTTIASGF